MTLGGGAGGGRRRAAGLACALAVLLPMGVARAAPVPGSGSQCFREGRIWAGSMRYADELLASRYTFSPYPTVRLPENPTWAEDPFGERSWRSQFHKLLFSRHLLHAWLTTGDTRYLLRFRFLLMDWLVDNPQAAPPSDFSWSDSGAAFRAMIFACASEHLPPEPWIHAGLVLHGSVLADPAFQGPGNHALDQALGLLAVGCELIHVEWIRLARERIARLAAESIDAEGVTNEQAVDYQLYNYLRYGEAIDRLRACGQPVPDGLEERRALMPDLLAHATLPNAEYEMIGDSRAGPAEPIPGTTAEFAASSGASGPKPARRFALYRAGFAFGRTGWGEARPYADEVSYSLRFGPGRNLHGHADGGALTVYGYGSRLLLDSGRYKYELDRWRAFFRSPRAHNVVTVDRAPFDLKPPTALTARRSTDAFDYLAVAHRAWSDAVWVRRVVFSRGLGYLLVQDVVRADRPRVFRQLWHLAPDAAPVVGDGVVSTRRGRGNVSLLWLGETPGLRVVEGRLDPIQGWVSFTYRERLPSPTVEAVMRGRTARYLTLVVPSGSPAARVEVRDVEVRGDGFDVTVALAGRAERVVVRGDGASLRTL